MLASAIPSFSAEYTIDDQFDASPEYGELLLDRFAQPVEFQSSNYTVEGKFNLKTKQPSKTKIRPSKLQGIFSQPPVTEPAALHNKDTRLDEDIFGTDLMAKQLDKYGQPNKPFPRKFLRMACDDIQQQINTMKTDIKPRVLTESEAINGLPGVEFFDRMDMQTSPGFPYTKTRLPGQKGKSYLFDLDESDNYQISDPTLRYNLDRRHAQAKQGQKGFSLWMNNFKDERRKTARVKRGETRVFCIGPVDYTILCRMYFLAFCAALMKNRISTCSAMGINVDGPEWTTLYRKLKSVGKNGFDGDYKNFDGTANSEILWELCRIVNEWYNDGPENALVRYTLIDEMIHTRSNYTGEELRQQGPNPSHSDPNYRLHLTSLSEFIIQKHIGDPSGVNLTGNFNTLTEAIYTRISYLGVMSERQARLATMQVFRDFVRDSCFGDDNIQSAPDHILSYWNRVTVAEYLARYGIKYTDASKSLNMTRFDSIDSLTFLKRKFYPHKEFPDRILAPIDPNTIFELVNWVTVSLDPGYQLRLNVTDALRFSYHYGRKFYSTLRAELTHCLAKVDEATILPDYDHYEAEWFQQWTQAAL
jgi:hypothetical protein